MVRRLSSLGGGVQKKPRMLFQAAQAGPSPRTICKPKYFTITGLRIIPQTHHSAFRCCPGYVRACESHESRMDLRSIQKGKLRQIQKSRRLLHEALVSLILEKKYESITVQQILDRANVGRSTFYLHFKDKDDLLTMGFDYMGELLREIQAMHRDTPVEPHEKLIAFSLPMFMHMYEFRAHSRAFAGTSEVRDRIQHRLAAGPMGCSPARMKATALESCLPRWFVNES